MRYRISIERRYDDAKYFLRSHHDPLDTRTGLVAKVAKLAARGFPGWPTDITKAEALDLLRRGV